MNFIEINKILETREFLGKYPKMTEEEFKILILKSGMDRYSKKKSLRYPYNEKF